MSPVEPSLDDLDAHISAVLAHPDTPVSLYDVTADELLLLSNSARANVVGSADVLRVALPLMLLKVKEQEEKAAAEEDTLGHSLFTH